MDYKFRTFLVVLLVSYAALLHSQPAYAGNDTLKNLIKFMYENKQLNREQFETLMNGINIDDKQTESTTKAMIKEETKEIVEEQANDSVKVTTKGKFQVESADKNFKFRLGGRIQLDAAVYDDDKSSFGNQTEVRRARLYLSGTLWQDWDFKSQFDFAGDRVRTNDLYIRYTGWGPYYLTVGHFKEPFSLEGLTSSRYITFLERALPDVLTPSRNLGIGFNTYRDNWTVSLGLFADGLDDKEPEGVDESYAVTGRATVAPIHDDNRLLHLGASFSHRELNRGNNTMKLEQRPEAHTADQNLVSTGDIAGVDSFNRYGFETAFVYGAVSLQGQYLFMDIEREDHLDDLGFSGYYIEGSWFLTGEQRKYNAKKGVFDYPDIDNIVGMGGVGAWQLAVRFSSLDLTDGTTIGGEEENLTVGLNWYSTPNIRFIFNYTKVLDLYRPGSIHHNDEPSIFQVRAQLHW